MPVASAGEGANAESTVPITIGNPNTEGEDFISVAVSPGGTPGTLQTTSVTEKVPVVFRWKGNGSRVYVSGTFNNWKHKIRLVRSVDDFSIILSLPPGQHKYRFIVDGKWRYATDQASVVDYSGGRFNVVNAEPTQRFYAGNGSGSLFDKATHGPESKKAPQRWSQQVPVIESGKEPPSLPAHLLRALLNTAPTTDNPSMLPLPHHVMLNHLYVNHVHRDMSRIAISVDSTGASPVKSAPGTSASDGESGIASTDVEIMGVTSRFRTKFVTTVLYTVADPV